MDVLRVVGFLAADGRMRYDDVCINVSAGTRMIGCAATAAAFVNGVKAFGVMDGKPFLLPVLKFSYHEIVIEAKIVIPRAIDGSGGALDSPQTLANFMGLDKSLLSHHVQGAGKAAAWRTAASWRSTGACAAASLRHHADGAYAPFRSRTGNRLRHGNQSGLTMRTA